MPTTYKLIESRILSSSSSTVTFSSIPQTYTDLVFRISLRTDGTPGTNEPIRFRFNGVTTGNYSSTIIRRDETNVVSSRLNTQTSGFLGLLNTDGTLASTFSSSEFYIPRYTETPSKQCRSFSVMADSVANAYLSPIANFVQINAAITSISFFTSNAQNFMINSSFHLYGIKG